jgi:hypothetical protein
MTVEEAVEAYKAAHESYIHERALLTRLNARIVTQSKYLRVAQDDLYVAEQLLRKAALNEDSSNLGHALPQGGST